MPELRIDLTPDRFDFLTRIAAERGLGTPQEVINELIDCELVDEIGAPEDLTFVTASDLERMINERGSEGPARVMTAHDWEEFRRKAAERADAARTSVGAAPAGRLDPPPAPKPASNGAKHRTPKSPALAGAR